MSQRCQKQSGPSFDYLVGGGEQLVGDFEAERFRGCEVDDEIDLGRQLDRHVGRSRTVCLVGSRRPSANVLMRIRLVLASGSAMT